MEKLPAEISYSIVSYLDRPSLLALRCTNHLLANWALPRLVGALRLEDDDDEGYPRWDGRRKYPVKYVNMEEVVGDVLALAPFVKKLFVAPLYYQSGIWKIYEKERYKGYVDGYISQNDDPDLRDEIRQELRGDPDEDGYYDDSNNAEDEDEDEEDDENQADEVDALGEPVEVERSETEWDDLIEDTYYKRVRENRLDGYNAEMVKMKEVEKEWEAAVELQNKHIESAEAAICKLIERMRLLQSVEIKTRRAYGYKRFDWECDELIVYDPSLSTTTSSLDTFAKALHRASAHISELILRDVYSLHLQCSDHMLHAFRNLEKLEIYFLETGRWLETEPRTDDWAKVLAETRHTLRELTIRRLPEKYNRDMHCLQDLLGQSPKENLLPIVFPQLKQLSLAHLTTTSDFLGPFLAAQVELRILKTEKIALENSYSSWDKLAETLPAKLEIWHVEDNFERRDVGYGDVIQYNIMWSWRQDFIGKPPHDWELPGWGNDIKMGTPLGKAIFRRKPGHSLK
ncbi:hypothetical protein TWF694_005220 [Orbilia ellipsospora]|uniref:F-box domain-containing protein n=1 Tax=Orbilia ellipsospora TaxID=2528407 RepID=A0AAV9WWH8_9PEZI